MGLELTVRDPCAPSLPPIRTSEVASAGKPVEGDGDVLPEPKPLSGAGQEDSECVTPKRAPPLVCPPAPRKPRPAKRKFAPPAAGFYPVPVDLAAVFVPLPFPATASKKIRVG